MLGLKLIHVSKLAIDSQPCFTGIHLLFVVANQRQSFMGNKLNHKPCGTLHDTNSNFVKRFFTIGLLECSAVGNHVVTSLLIACGDNLIYHVITVTYGLTYQWLLQISASVSVFFTTYLEQHCTTALYQLELHFTDRCDISQPVHIHSMKSTGLSAVNPEASSLFYCCCSLGPRSIVFFAGMSVKSTPLFSIILWSRHTTNMCFSCSNWSQSTGYVHLYTNGVI